jgi:putative transposase
LEEGHVWQRRFYDFLLWNPHKRSEKLGYMHRNPVKRGLVAEPEQWKWNSCRYYAYDEGGTILVNEQQPVKLKRRVSTSPVSTDEKKIG